MHSFTISGVNIPAVAVQDMPRGINELDRRQALQTIGVTTLGALSLGTGIAASHGNDTAHANSDLGDVRRATEQYHDVQVALDDGFQETHECVPQMGVHFVHPGRMQDAILDPERPEVLIYEPHESEDGETQYKLVGVEYFIAEAKASGTPTLFDEEFDGPMPGHGPNQPRHYDLHAWVWRNNPDGVFTAHNPNVKC